MRILDRILAGECAGVDMASFKEAAQGMEVFDISNVAEYLYAQTDQEVWNIEHDFPCLAPPFPRFWMEFTRPSRLVSELTGVQKTADIMPHRTGLHFDFAEANMADINHEECLVISKKLEDSLSRQLASRPDLMAEFQRLRAENFPFGNPRDPAWRKLSPEVHLVVSRFLQMKTLQLNPIEAGQTLTKLGTRWILRCTFFMQAFRHGPVIGPLGYQLLQIGSNGAVQPDTCVSGFDVRAIPNYAWLNEDAMGGLSTLWFSGLLAISFLHCKNVTIAREHPPDPALAKRQRKRGIPPRVIFKVLEIAPMKKVLERAQDEHHTNLQRALHICRGHFANYEEHFLFGKYQGRFWIPQHLRGSLEKGLVHKEYDIKAPKCS